MKTGFYVIDISIGTELAGSLLPRIGGGGCLQARTRLEPGLEPVVVGHGPQSMLGRVVGSSSVVKAENRLIWQLIRLVFSGYR